MSREEEMKAYQEDLKAYLDGELSLSRSAEIARAIDGGAENNPGLAQELADLKEITRYMSTQLEEAQPEGLERTLDALDAAEAAVPAPEQKKPRQISRQFVVWGSLAACLVGAYFVQRSFSGTNGSDASVTTATVATATPSMAVDKAGIPAAPAPTTRAKASDLNGISGESAKYRPEFSSGGSYASATPRAQMVAKTADIGLAVVNIQSAMNGANRALDQAGAFVQNSTVSVPRAAEREAAPNGAQFPVATANIEAEVPSVHLERVLEQVSQLGTVRSQQVTAGDVTNQLNSISKELTDLKGQLADDDERLKSVADSKSVKRLKELRSQAREQIRELTDSKEAMESQVAMSHLSIHLEQDADQAADMWARNGLAVTQFEIGLVQFLLFALVWIPVWVPAGLVALWLTRKEARK